MFIDLPQPVQRQVLYFLETDNFRAAKALYDQHNLPAQANNQATDSSTDSAQ